MSTFNRRKFLAATGLAVLPSFIPLAPTLSQKNNKKQQNKASRTIRFYGDGENYEPLEYLTELHKAHAAHPIVKDVYGSGGVVKELEQKFIQITGKEAAIFMPSGTMANQLAIAVLSGDKSKVFVQDTSHVYRDEADAAQTIHNKRLMPLAKGETYFTVGQLHEAIEALPQEEYFQTGIGAVSIENPVRRTGGKTVPIDEIRKISAFCKSKGIPLHLDGARLYMASAWTGVPIKEYASYFNTVYISLYKYLGADAGAILCGDKAVINKMSHVMKVHGGIMYSNWTNAAMALYKLEGFEERLKEAKKRGEAIFKVLNSMKEIQITQIPGGTNIYSLQFGDGIDGPKLKAALLKNYNIDLPLSNRNKEMIKVNETLTYQSADAVINAFKNSI